MNYRNTTISFKFQKIEKIKKCYILNEDCFKEYFNEGTVFPIPEEAPEDIPRIIVKSKNEHTQITITQNAINMQTNYDGAFANDWSKCESYLKERVRVVFDFLSRIMEGNNYSYVGIITNILYDEGSCNNANTLANNLLKSDRLENLYDLNIRYTFVDGDKYINIALQNMRIFDNEINPNIPGTFREDKMASEKIGVVLDINDRYAFNTNENYVSRKEQIESLLETATHIINNKLGELIERGVYYNE